MAHPALIKRTSNHCKTVEFPMKACWKEDAQAVANEPQEETAIESYLQFLTSTASPSPNPCSL
jgi:hypothetical protein